MVFSNSPDSQLKLQDFFSKIPLGSTPRGWSFGPSRAGEWRSITQEVAWENGRPSRATPQILWWYCPGRTWKTHGSQGIYYMIQCDTVTGWWWMVAMNLAFSHILGMSSSQLTNSYFSEGWPNQQPGDDTGSFSLRKTWKTTNGYQRHIHLRYGGIGQGNAAGINLMRFVWGRHTYYSVSFVDTPCATEQKVTLNH